MFVHENILCPTSFSVVEIKIIFFENSSIGAETVQAESKYRNTHFFYIKLWITENKSLEIETCLILMGNWEFWKVTLA